MNLKTWSKVELGWKALTGSNELEMIATNLESVLEAIGPLKLLTV